VSIGDEAENQWVLDTFGPTAIAAASVPAPWLWIGFTDAAEEDSWLWTSGDPITYTNWGGNEPNGMPVGVPPEDYAVMTPKDFNGIAPGEWLDTTIDGSPLNTFGVVAVP